MLRDRGRRRSAGVRGRDARARSAGRAGARRRAVGGRLVQPAQPRAVSADRSARGTAGAWPKCPAFKSKDSVLQRPERRDRRPDDGLPRPARVRRRLLGRLVGSGAWRRLSSARKPPFGVRREDLIVKDVPKQRDCRRPHRYDRWRLARQDARDGGSVPSMRLATVREWTADPLRAHPAWTSIRSRLRSST